VRRTEFNHKIFNLNTCTNDIAWGKRSKTVGKIKTDIREIGSGEWTRFRPIYCKLCVKNQEDIIWPALRNSRA
jgi:hypothetical protein